MRSILLAILILSSCWCADAVKVPSGAVLATPSAAVLDGVWRVGIANASAMAGVKIACDGDSYVVSYSEKAIGSGKIGAPISFDLTSEDGVGEYTGGQVYTLKDGSVVIIGSYTRTVTPGTDPGTGAVRKGKKDKPVKWTAFGREPRS